jgi:hypothetical protein
MILQNNSPNSFRLDGATGNVIAKTIHREDLQNGAAHFEASGTATQPGTLELDVTLIPLLADASATRFEEISGGTGTTGAEGEEEIPDKTQEKEKKPEKKRKTRARPTTTAKALST